MLNEQQLLLFDEYWEKTKHDNSAAPPGELDAELAALAIEMRSLASSSVDTALVAEIRSNLLKQILGEAQYQPVNLSFPQKVLNALLRLKPDHPLDLANYALLAMILLVLLQLFSPLAKTSTMQHVIVVAKPSVDYPGCAIPIVKGGSLAIDDPGYTIPIVKGARHLSTNGMSSEALYERPIIALRKSASNQRVSTHARSIPPHNKLIATRSTSSRDLFGSLLSWWSLK